MDHTAFNISPVLIELCLCYVQKESIAEQIQQIMELENLEEARRWRIQAEANDEAERLLSSEAIPTEQIVDR
ncbi:unnamed protein product [Ilex paraguariensis]|uniref:Uncharacterized protein n=1 Tax=Ilex paraguariensis TaxID=185542 RepID=A0ABC8UK71_9AQUA